MAQRLFIGVCPTGIAYADRDREENGDYKRVAFLPFDTLALEVRDVGSPLLVEATEHAAKIQARRGELFAISACGAADLAAGRPTAQAVVLGRAMR